ncbi:hypothetical protein JOC77_001907 [Peribacillus deserti]|uniref:DUF3800 domain-containing protein n=1 Tax=Peribacillus deserti TaxID=673318 RepID=A0ABS2QH43_9BACI|nr:DUF3800 domain-containing protein [Peribacillus deserti]MBM7692477.1 hypothetical protein [Peribacillus deserti]
MSNGVLYAFIDEFGNYGFDFEKKDVSTHFIIAAILVEVSNKEMLEQKIEIIRRKYFQTGEMKSSKIKNSHRRRIQILSEIKELPFQLYAYVIDKTKIRETGGLGYKKSFFKYLNNLLYKDLYKTFEELQLVADEHGSKEFMQEFKTYVKRKSIPDLFNFSTFGFNDSKSDILLQLADLLAGTIAKGYDKQQLTDEYKSFHSILKNRIIRINYWPKDYKTFLFGTCQGII